MDYFTVAVTSNFAAALATASLLAILVFQSISQTWKLALVIGVSGQLIWITTLLSNYLVDISPNVLFLSESLRLACWFICLYLLLINHTKLIDWPGKLKLIAVFTLILAIYSVYVIQVADSTATRLRLVFLLIATMNLVLTEQVARNLNGNRVIKLFGLCLTFFFAYDILINGEGLLTGSISSITLQGRSALAFTIAIALATGAIIFNNQKEASYLFSVSRPAVFYSTAILFSGLLITIITVGKLYVSDKGFLGTYLFALALLASLLLLITLLISRAFRQSFEVFISKHFFSLKYDYRIEWLKAIRNLSELSNDKAKYYDEILQILTEALRANKGSLWISNGSELQEVTSNLSLNDAPESIQINEPFVRTMLKESWIYAPQVREPALAKHNSLIPDWVLNDKNIWLIAPLIIQMKLVGLVVLSKPRPSDNITYEDRDLMTNISTQVASNILLHQQEVVISDAKQMETYNRLSAFIMHDMNNIIAQLALIGKNAQRHRDNPAFIDDMIKTVHNATERMQTLVQKFNPAAKENRSSFKASELIHELVKSVSEFQPVPEVGSDHDFEIHADMQKMLLALKNLVRNAQEATNEEGTVRISTQVSSTGHQIIVEDSGHGMSQQFIAEELFRPFSTTKEDKGVGIGAYLTKSYIEHVGALLNVTSEEGKGTCFKVTFVS